MLPWILGTAGTIVPWLPAIVAVVGGAWAIVVLRRSTMRQRGDRSLAIWLIAAVGALAGVVTTLLVASIMVMFSSRSPDVVAALPFGLAAGVAVALAACLGYVAATRRAAGRSAVMGVLLGPAVLIVASMLSQQFGQTLARASEDAGATEAADIVAQRSATLELSATDITVETARGREVVAAVRLDATIRAGTSIQIEPSQRANVLRFLLIPNAGADVKDQMNAEVPPGSPTALAPGVDAVFEIEFRYESSTLLGEGTIRPGEPGRWLLVAEFLDVNGQEYRVETLIDIGS
jgi:hypothetical protein